MCYDPLRFNLMVFPICRHPLQGALVNIWHNNNDEQTTNTTTYE